MGRSSKVGAASMRLVAVAGPVLLGLLTALYIGRPSHYFLATGITLASAILACDGWIMARRHWVAGALALGTQIAFLIFVGTYTASPLPAPSPISDPLPQASPPGGMAIYALPTGVNHRTAAFAYRGGSPWDKRDSVLTAVLVRHPQGDLLIDTGLGRTIAEQIREFPFLFRLGTDLVRFQAAATSSDPQGTDGGNLAHIL